MSKDAVTFGIGLVILVLAGFLTAAASGRDGRAVGAAERWVAFVDSGKYGESWEETASSFRSAIGKEHWEALLRTVREPLGRTLCRRVRETAFEENFPGMPDGKHVAVEFGTALEHHGSAVETLAVVLEEDGRWRVAGYCIH